MKGIKFWLEMKSVVTEFKSSGGKLVRSEIENNSQLVFIFVRGDEKGLEFLCARELIFCVFVRNVNLV